MNVIINLNRAYMGPIWNLFAKTIWVRYALLAGQFLTNKQGSSLRDAVAESGRAQTSHVEGRELNQWRTQSILVATILMFGITKIGLVSLVSGYVDQGWVLRAPISTHLNDSQHSGH